MSLRTRWLGLAGVVLFCVCSTESYAQVSVTTYHNDNSRTGANTQESILTPANVNSSQFGKLFSVPVDGAVYAQPLYLANVTIDGGPHNVVYIATEHDSVYAIDADTGRIYWQISLIPPGGSTFNTATDVNCGDQAPEIGITGTPVIDTTTGTLYLVAKVKLNGVFSQYLHALDVSTAAEKFGGPMSIHASVPGKATDGDGSMVSFNPRMQNQRAGLLLENGHLVIAWSSHCDNLPYHGWVMAYGATTLTLEGAYNSSADGMLDGIWMGAGGPAADANGNIYVATGNGSWNGTTNLGSSIIKLGPPSNSSLPILDYFTTFNQGTLSTNDEDVASGGLILLPTLPSGQELLTLIGKEGRLYLVDRNSMGKYCGTQPGCTASNPNIVQEIPQASTGIFGTPAYWNGTLYWAGGNDLTGAIDPLKSFSFNANGSGLISTTPTSATARSFSFSGPVPSVSANGATNGIVWGLDNSQFASTCSGGTHCQVLYAYSATNLGTMLYNSGQASNSRDVPGGAVKFTTPTVANGKVYVGSKSSISVFGLLSAVPATATPPTFSPSSGTYNSPQTVTLADSTPGAEIFYTTDGTAPTTSSARYSAPLQVSVTTTIKAIAAASGYFNSAVVSATYVILGPQVQVSLSAVDNVHGLVNNGTPVSGGGIDGLGYAYSETLTGTSVTWAGATFSLGGSGSANAASSVTLALPAGSYSTVLLLGTGVRGNQPNQTFVVTYTDGTSASFVQSLSDWHTPQHYAGESTVLTMAYRVASTGATQAGAFYLYGYSLAINSTKSVKSITLPNNRNVVVLAVDLIQAGTLPVASSPQVSPSGGNYSTTQSVALADPTPGAVIYYTMDGTTPTTSSAKYSTPILVSVTTTIKAIAVASGYANSAVTTATYTISGSQGPIDVNLAAVGNVHGLVNNGTPVSSGGIDGLGYAYSETLTGTSVTWAGATFSLGASGTANAVSSVTVPLPAGNYSAILLIGTGVRGNQANQTFVVAYADGTSTSFVQSLSDWHTPQNYPGESEVLTMAYRVTSTGATQAQAFYLYGYSLALNSAKTVKSIKLPSNRNVVLVGVALAP